MPSRVTLKSTKNKKRVKEKFSLHNKKTAAKRIQTAAHMNDSG
jgi:hypothetical protein